MLHSFEEVACLTQMFIFNIFGCFRACVLAYMPVSNQSINKSVNLAWPFMTALVSGVAASRPSQRVSSRVESRVIVFQVKSSLKFLSLCPSQVQVVKK